MTGAIFVLCLVASVAAEAPYVLPRPGPQAQPFRYPAPPPPPAPIQYPAQQVSNAGYQYQQPNIRPAFIQQAPQLKFQPQFQQQQALPAPLPQYQPQVAPQPLPVAPRPQPIIPSTSYGVPQFPLGPQQLPQPLPQQIQTLPAFIPHSQPAPIPQPQPAPIIQSQPAPVFHPVQYYQPQINNQQGYNYQQPQLRLTQQLPLQINSNIGQETLSSYQADSNQYNNGAVQQSPHREVFDSTVLERVQSLIKEDEHLSAKNSGYLSLVSGVSLENARPSVEISSFVQNSQEPVSAGLISSASSSQLGPSGPSAPSAEYSLPAVEVNSASSSSTGFVPAPQLAPVYGPPNK